MKSKKIFPVFYFFFLFTAALCAQDNPESVELPPFADGLTPVLTESQPDDADTDESEISANGLLSDEEGTEKARELSPEQQRVEMEIKTSTLNELAQWCRSLELPESGTREELSRRIMQHYEIPEPGIQADTGRKVIIIESAQTSEYFKIEVSGEEYARLKGEVKVSLTDDNSIHRISAGEILFNRTRNTLTASGKVVYEKETGDTIETFRGESITVNLNDWSSVFLGGGSERMMDSEGTAYLFSGTVMSHTSEDATIMRKAKITNAKDEESLWSISASKLWLLPGSDFAFVNAVLRVGEIPVLYIPAFYFPADEMIFHPVIGYKSREGGFIQTTTYIIGHPRAETSEISSITNILGNTDEMEKERHGLFLRSTGKMLLNPDELSLKAMLDYYVNLGTFFGLGLYVPKTGILNPLDLYLGFGVTRTLTLADFGYTPFAPNYDGTSDWNKSNFLSSEVPFRYRIHFQSSIDAQYSDLSWNLPYYSDPYVNRDFMIRSEKMDWFNMLQTGAVSEEDEAMDAEIGAYEWHINWSLNPSVEKLNPYISRISVSGLSTSLTFKTIMDDVVFATKSEAPGRHFYAPDKYTIYNFTGSVSGTPFTAGGTSTSPSNRTAPNVDDLFKGIGEPVSPWDNENTANSGSNEKISDDKLIPPVLSQRFEIPAAGDIKFEIDYQISPASASELQFMSGSWKSYDQVDWSEVRTVLTSFGGNSSINFRVNQAKGLFSNEFTLSGSGMWSDYTYLNEEADIFLDNLGNTDQSKIDSLRRQQYSQTNYSTSYAYNSTLRPLYQNDIFGQSSLQYNLRGTIVRSSLYAGGDEPELSPQWGSWVKEETVNGVQTLGLNIHRFSTNLAADIMDKLQNISVSIDMPPLDTLIATNTAFRFWITETRTDFRIRKQPETNQEPEKWVYEPINFTETLNFRKESSLVYYMVITPEEDNDITTITSTLTLWNFRVSFKALKSQRYRFEPYNPSNVSAGGRWEQYDDPSLIPVELAFFYRQSFLNVDIIRNRLDFSLDVDSSLTFNLQQRTNSNFQFQMGFTFGIAGFMDLKFSVTSENNVIWRYFKGISGMEETTAMYMEGPQNNVFTDLVDSFNFFNDSKRQRSGFKMKKFDLSAIHYLGDWTADFGISMYPYFDNTSTIPRYRVVSDISFTVQWKPIAEIKSSMEYKGETERWAKK